MDERADKGKPKQRLTEQPATRLATLEVVLIPLLFYAAHHGLRRLNTARVAGVTGATAMSFSNGRLREYKIEDIYGSDGLHWLATDGTVLHLAEDPTLDIFPDDRRAAYGSWPKDRLFPESPSAMSDDRASGTSSPLKATSAWSSCSPFNSTAGLLQDLPLGRAWPPPRKSGARDPERRPLEPCFDKPDRAQPCPPGRRPPTLICSKGTPENQPKRK